MSNELIDHINEHMPYIDGILEEQNIPIHKRFLIAGKLFVETATLDMTHALYTMLARRRKIEKGEYVFTRKGEPVSKRFLNAILPKLCKKAKVPQFPVHGIRHHVAALLTYKLSLAQISKILRHRRMTTTDIYLRSIVKIETKGIKVLDEIGTQKIVPFLRSVK